MEKPNRDSVSEREKWEADTRLRERELLVKEREQDIRSREADGRIEELNRSKWTSPLVIAVFAAAIAAAGSASVALINGFQQRGQDERRTAAENKLEIAKAQSQQQLEQGKAEAARILEVIKTTDPDKAAVNLEFLLKAGLISSQQLRVDLQSYLRDRHPGQGASLPFVAQSPGSYTGQIIGTGRDIALCQAAAGTPLTRWWRRGTRVRGNTYIEVGTVIATFNKDGTYGSDMSGSSGCAIYLSQDEAGIRVLDQWLGHAAGERIIPFNGGIPINNGDEFFVVLGSN